MVRLYLRNELVSRLGRELERFGVEFKKREVGPSYSEIEMAEEHLDLLKKVFVEGALKEGRVRGLRCGG